MALIIALIILSLAISYLIAEEFMEISRKKGYSDKKYFWYCFLFGIVGYLMVIALPMSENSTANCAETSEEHSMEDSTIK